MADEINKLAPDENSLLTDEQQKLAEERQKNNLCMSCGKALYWECNGPMDHLKRR